MIDVTLGVLFWGVILTMVVRGIRDHGWSESASNVWGYVVLGAALLAFGFVGAAVAEKAGVDVNPSCKPDPVTMQLPYGC